MTFATVLSGLLCSLPQSGLAAVIIDSDTSYWSAITYGTNSPDTFIDQQTGLKSGDLVGDVNHPAFYSQFDDAGTSNLTDGTLAFRVRLNEAKNYSKLEFNYYLFVGLDADRNGSLDLFVGVNGNTELCMWDPGTGANTGPSTTSIVSPPALTVAQDSANYAFSLLSAMIDPDAISYDIDGGEKTDMFLSFSVDFYDVVTLLSAKGIVIDQNTGINYVMATSTQDNALNMDLNGVDGGVGSTLTFDELGATSATFSPTGDATIPEPSVIGLFAGVSGLLLMTRRIFQI